MANEFDWQGPRVKLQDVILMDFACQTVANGLKLGGPLQCPDSSMPGKSTIEQIWADNPDMMPTVLQVGQWNKQAAWWVSKRQSGAGSALRAVFKTYAQKFPKDSVAGRVAAIGFSQGCQGIKELISGKDDADRVDFVYACDGMHGALDAQGSVTEASIAPWVDFGVQAATGDKMMVVTHSEIVPENRPAGVAGTEETAQAFLSLVQSKLGYKEVAPRMLPRGLIGDPAFAPKPSSGAWPGWSNSLSQSVSISGWPVKYYKIIGNLIVVGFKAISEEESAKGYTSSNSGAAHIFQDWWVKDQVLREVLACRWAAKCSSDMLNPENLPSRTMSLSTAPTVKLLSSPRFPSVLYAEPKPTVTLKGTSGLGTVASGGACVLEGVFSNVLSASEMSNARTVSAVKTAAIGVGAVAGGWWLLRKILDRRQ
jgi:hypothetical protein